MNGQRVPLPKEVLRKHAPLATLRFETGRTNGGRDKLRFTAHTLKGSVRYFGAGQVYEHAAQLEDMGRKGEFAGAGAIFAVLEGEFSDYLRGI